MRLFCIWLALLVSLSGSAKCVRITGSRKGNRGASMNDKMSTLFHQLECEDGLHRCIIEDNGRVAYAYLVKGNTTVGDLWLYNQAESPIEPEWRDRTKMPFLNPVSFVDSVSMAQPLKTSDDLAVVWELDQDGIVTKAKLFLFGQLYGVLAPLAKPGWCIAALKDGPLAKTLNID